MAAAADHVQRGATSQDLLDTAAMLLARDAGRVILDDLDDLDDLDAALSAATVALDGSGEPGAGTGAPRRVVPGGGGGT